MIVNHIILTGHLGADPEVRALETGIKTARMNLATNERYTTTTGEQVTHTEWHNVVVWRDLAIYAERNCRRGSFVRIEGKLRSRETIDPLTLVTQKTYEIIAHSVQLLSNDAITSATEKKSPIEPLQPSPLDPDNLPF